MSSNNEVPWAIPGSNLRCFGSRPLHTRLALGFRQIWTCAIAGLAIVLLLPALFAWRNLILVESSSVATVSSYLASTLREPIARFNVARISIGSRCNVRKRISEVSTSGCVHAAILSYTHRRVYLQICSNAHDLLIQKFEGPMRQATVEYPGKPQLKPMEKPINE